ncbi:hypothetical protein ACNKHT_02395 [Shigella flexneri]
MTATSTAPGPVRHSTAWASRPVLTVKPIRALSDLSYLRCIPEMVMITPAMKTNVARCPYGAITITMARCVRYPRGNAVGVATDAAAKTTNWQRHCEALWRETGDL